MDHWRRYLQLAEFVIFTDQKSLIHLNEQRLNTPWQQKMFSKLLGLQYKLVNKKGSDNSVADALSRRPHTDYSLAAISTASPRWIADIADSYKNDAFSGSIISRLAVDSSAVPFYTWHGGILRFKNKIWVGFDPSIHHRIVDALHSSPIGGHSGIPITLRRLKSYFTWKGMRKFVHSFVSACQICQ